MSQVQEPLVSVVLVNFRGAADTIEAIRQLGEIDWPQEQLEIIVVENASGDDSAQRIREAAPHVTLIVSKTNDGFAGGCNRGVAKARGEYVAFLNNDARPDAQWVRAAVARFERSPQIAAVASRVLDWEGKRVDYIGSAMTWYGMGYKPFTAEPVPAGRDRARDVLFGTGAAMFVRRSVYEEVGGFDDSYFMFFEDVDLGWRLNLLGWRFVYEPASLAYHKHHASMRDFGSFKESYLLERNALYTLYKNLSAESLAEALPAAIALSVRRGISRGVLDSTSFDLRKPGGDAEDTLVVSKQTVAGVFAIDQFVEALPGLREARDRIQATRLVTDRRIWRLFGLADAPIYHQKDYMRGYENLISTFNVTEAPRSTKVLIITGDPIGRKIAGPAIRTLNMARQLARDNSVTVLSLSEVEPIDTAFEVVQVKAGDQRGFKPYEQWADVIIFQGHAMAVFEALRTTRKIVVADIYDPMHLEQLEQGKAQPAAEHAQLVKDATEVLNEQLASADFFLCASERQRHFWLGQLAALGRINPLTYESDPDLDGLIAVAPFGLPATPPTHTKSVLKGVLPGIGKSDKLVLWSGGLYNWFDPKTLIRAMADLSTRRKNVRLFFQGTKHPNPHVPEMEIVAESRALAQELGVLDRSVFFNASWVDYDERQNYLTEADAGVSTHFSHIETTFSFRTRILDYLWAELPMVVTAGDHFAEVIEKEKLGIVVDALDVAGLSAALERVLFDEKFVAEARRNIRRVRERYYWEVTLAPLVDFVANPQHARDRRQGQTAVPARGVRRKRQRRSGLLHDLRQTARYLRTGGPAVVAQKIARRLRRS